MNGEFCFRAFVQCTLPPVSEVTERVYQAFTSQVMGTKVYDRNLLPWLAGERTGVMAGNENTIIGQHADMSSGTHIINEQADIS